MYFTTQSVQFCTTVHNVQLCTTIENVQLCTTNRDQAGNKQGDIQFWNGQTGRLCNQLSVMGKLLSAVMGKQSSALISKLSWAQEGRERVSNRKKFSFDHGQTDSAQVQVLSCAFTAKSQYTLWFMGYILIQWYIPGFTVYIGFSCSVVYPGSET